MNEDDMTQYKALAIRYRTNLSDYMKEWADTFDKNSLSMEDALDEPLDYEQLIAVVEDLLQLNKEWEEFTRAIQREMVEFMAAETKGRDDVASLSLHRNAKAFLKHN